MDGDQSHLFSMLDSESENYTVSGTTLKFSQTSSHSNSYFYNNNNSPLQRAVFHVLSQAHYALSHLTEGGVPRAEPSTLCIISFNLPDCSLKRGLQCSCPCSQSLAEAALGLTPVSVSPRAVVPTSTLH